MPSITKVIKQNRPAIYLFNYLDPIIIVTVFHALLSESIWEWLYCRIMGYKRVVKLPIMKKMTLKKMAAQISKKLKLFVRCNKTMDSPSVPLSHPPIKSIDIFKQYINDKKNWNQNIPKFMKKTYLWNEAEDAWCMSKAYAFTIRTHILRYSHKTKSESEKSYNYSQEKLQNTLIVQFEKMMNNINKWSVLKDQHMKKLVAIYTKRLSYYENLKNTYIQLLLLK